MLRDTHGGLRDGRPGRAELVRRGDPIERAPTERGALPPWAAQRERAEGRREGSRLLARGTLEVRLDDPAAHISIPVRSPDVVVGRTNPRGREPSTSTAIPVAEILSRADASAEEKREERAARGGLASVLSMAAVFRGINDTTTAE